jgi:hypothetical protein
MRFTPSGKKRTVQKLWTLIKLRREALKAARNDETARKVYKYHLNKNQCQITLCKLQPPTQKKGVYAAKHFLELMEDNEK